MVYHIGLINFEDKKFRGFRGYLLNLEIKYPRRNFLYTRSRFFVQHVHVVGKWLALWKYFKRAAEVKTSLPSPHIKTHLWDLSTNLSKLNIFLKLKNIVLYES